VGAALVAFGFWLAYPPAGYMIGGAMLIAGAVFSAIKPKRAPVSQP
jgi:hypothetical protein